MFFPQLMNIRRNDLVLEIGPGAYPFWRSDCLADKYDNESDVDLSQFGGDLQKTKGKPLFRIENNELPFKDNSFDFIICSHVLEHVPVNDLPQLIRELMRVAKKAYIEFPRPIYDYFYNFDVHLNFMDIVNGEIICIDKANTDIEKLKVFQKYGLELRGKNTLVIENFVPSLIAVGYEFHNVIPLRILESIEEFMELVRLNPYMIKLPSLFWKVKNKINPVRISKRIKGELNPGYFTKYLNKQKD
jgi:SAM-dependent methyltransferase